MIFNIQTRPELAKAKLGKIRINFTDHALERAAVRLIKLHREIEVKAGMIVECEIRYNTLSKVVVRYPSEINKGFDDVLVLINNFHEWVLVTCYQNASTDKHSTLDKTRLAA